VNPWEQGSGADLGTAWTGGLFQVVLAEMLRRAGLVRDMRLAVL
jgi:hypothetical protein